MRRGIAAPKLNAIHAAISASDAVTTALSRVRLTERRFGEHATPPRRLEQLKRYGSVGADQLVFGMPLDVPMDAALESIRALG